MVGGMAGAYGPVASRVLLIARGIRIACALLTAAVLAGALAGCGGGERRDDGAEITSALRTSLTTRDPAVLCGETLSAGLQQRVYGSGARCAAVEARSAPTKVTPTGVTVTQVRVDGDRGTAMVALRGNGQDSVRGAVGLVREDGRWRLDELSAAFLRASFNAGLEGDGTLQGALVVCVGTKVRALDDAALRTLVYGAMGGRAEAQVQLREFVADCVSALNAPAAGDSA